jgi:hypothetical protein
MLSLGLARRGRNKIKSRIGQLVQRAMTARMFPVSGSFDVLMRRRAASPSKKPKVALMVIPAKTVIAVYFEYCPGEYDRASWIRTKQKIRKVRRTATIASLKLYTANRLVF